MVLNPFSGDMISTAGKLPNGMIAVKSFTVSYGRLE